jgi:prophage antirepressor-like protein
MNTVTTILEKFEYEGAAVRTVKGDDGKPWFCAADVCKVLQHSNPTMAVEKNCDTTKGLNSIDTLTNGGIQKLLFISEPNLYRLVCRSRLPAARKFEKLVFDELIPAAMRAAGVMQSAQYEEKTVTIPESRYVDLLETKVRFMEGRTKNYNGRRNATLEEIQTICKLWGAVSCLEIAKRINRDIRFVIYHGHKNREAGVA